MLLIACSTTSPGAGDDPADFDEPADGSSVTDDVPDGGGSDGPALDNGDSGHEGDAASPGNDERPSDDGDADDGGGADGGGGEDGGLVAPCNGHLELCTRRFDEVAYGCTHNSHAAEEYGFSTLNKNQKSGLQTQLEDGVRCMMLDVQEQSGEHILCHGAQFCALGSYGHIEALEAIKSFLDSHPREVLTLIYQNSISGDAIANDMASLGLDALAFSYDAAAGWPTLAEMIAENKRLVVTLENGGSSHAYMPNVWELSWDTPYSFHSTDEFSCQLNRGSRENPLFLLNHWVSQNILGASLPDEGKASTVNAYDTLYGRAKGCWDETGDLPNFVAVDFYEHGDLFRVIDALNGF